MYNTQAQPLTNAWQTFYSYILPNTELVLEVVLSQKSTYQTLTSTNNKDINLRYQQTEWLFNTIDPDLAPDENSKIQLK